MLREGTSHRRGAGADPGLAGPVAITGMRLQSPGRSTVPPTWRPLRAHSALTMGSGGTDSALIGGGGNAE